MISNHIEVSRRTKVKTLASFHDWSFLCAPSYASHANPLGTILHPPSTRVLPAVFRLSCFGVHHARPNRRGKLRCPTSDLLVYIALGTPIDFRVAGEASFRQFTPADIVPSTPQIDLSFPTAPLATLDPYGSPIWKQTNLHGGLSFSGFVILTSQRHSHPLCRRCARGMSTSIPMYQKNTLRHVVARGSMLVNTATLQIKSSLPSTQSSRFCRAISSNNSAE